MISNDQQIFEKTFKNLVKGFIYPDEEITFTHTAVNLISTSVNMSSNDKKISRDDFQKLVKGFNDPDEETAPEFSQLVIDVKTISSLNDYELKLLFTKELPHKELYFYKKELLFHIIPYVDWRLLSSSK